MGRRDERAGKWVINLGGETWKKEAEGRENEMARERGVVEGKKRTLRKVKTIRTKFNSAKKAPFVHRSNKMLET